ncbi:hypothetical protein C7S17_2740 [Burkholderia thailandensis]|nr:hypothetical protein [Burkholderia thailandensis]
MPPSGAASAANSRGACRGLFAWAQRSIPARGRRAAIATPGGSRAPSAPSVGRPGLLGGVLDGRRARTFPRWFTIDQFIGIG